MRTGGGFLVWRRSDAVSQGACDALALSGYALRGQVSRKDYFKFVHGSETSTTMHVSSGASCVMKFTIAGSRPSILSRSPSRQSTVRRLGTASVAILRSRTDHRQATEARTSFYLASRARAPEATAQPTCASPWWWSRSLQRGAAQSTSLCASVGCARQGRAGLALEAERAARSKARQHHLADGASRLQELHRPHEIGRVDASVVLPHGRANAPGIDEIGDLVQESCAGPRCRRSEARAA